MKKPKSKKNVKSILAISAALAILGGVLAAGILKNGSFSDELATSQKEKSDETIINHGIEVKHAQTIPGDGAHITQIFSYTITPSNASKEVTLEISWQDTSYTANTAEYFETSIDSTACEISIKCIQAFDHVAIAKVTSVIDSDFTSSITLNYVQKFLSFKERDQSARKIILTDTITAYQNPTDEDKFLKLAQSQDTAVCYPAFSTVYTKEYPDGHNATYVATYKRAKCYMANADTEIDLEDRYEEIMAAVDTEAGGGLWQKQTRADLIEGIAKVYERMTYDEQRRMNEAGYIGIKRHYPTKVSLGAISYTWASYWAIRVDVTTLRSYLADVTFSITETNLDF